MVPVPWWRLSAPPALSCRPWNPALLVYYALTGPTPHLACLGRRCSHALLDKHLPLSGGPFIVDVDGAAAIGYGRVIDNGVELAGAFFADPVGVDRRLLSVEAGLKSVANGFVQPRLALRAGMHQDPAVTGTFHRDGLGLPWTLAQIVE